MRIRYPQDIYHYFLAKYKTTKKNLINFLFRNFNHMVRKKLVTTTSHVGVKYARSLRVRRVILI